VATTIDLRDPTIPLPSYLLIDANIFLHATKPDVAPFLARVRRAYHSGDVYPMICTLTLEECYHTLLAREYRKLLPKLRNSVAKAFNKQPSGVTWIDVYKQRPRLVKKYFPRIKVFFSTVSQLPVHIIEPEDLANPGQPPLEERMRHYMESCWLLGKDAYLVAVAERLGIQHIATLDSDFQRLGRQFTLYTKV
jgi:predicted nucleic acid-binding protein